MKKLTIRKDTEDTGKKLTTKKNTNRKISRKKEIRKKVLEINEILKTKYETTNKTTNRKKRFLVVRHLRTDGYGCVTVACLITPKKNFMVVGFSLCSPSDSFCKRDGRIRALRRMNKKPLEVDITLRETRINEEVITILDNEWMLLFPKAVWIPNFLKNYSRGITSRSET